MLKKKVNYKDFNGVEQTEEMYFNLTEAEMTRLDTSFPGGLETYVATLDEKTDPGQILRLFETILGQSWGQKSDDGKYFLKFPEEVQKWKMSAAYNALFVELLMDTEKATAFFNAIITTG